MTIDTTHWNLVDLVRRQAKAHGEREFMAFQHGTRLTFASLDRDSDRLACNLATLGVVPGDRVMAVLKNRIEFMQAFGGTEISVVCFTRLDDPLVPGMAGHVVDDLYEIRVVDTETDVPVPQGEIGEITIRPKLSFAFNQGYFRMPEKTVDAWRNLWHHTGDAGYFDA